MTDYQRKYYRVVTDTEFVFDSYAVELEDIGICDDILTIEEIKERFQNSNSEWSQGNGKVTIYHANAIAHNLSEKKAELIALRERAVINGKKVPTSISLDHLSEVRLWTLHTLIHSIGCRTRQRRLYLVTGNLLKRKQTKEHNTHVRGVCATLSRALTMWARKRYPTTWIGVYVKANTSVSDLVNLAALLNAPFEEIASYSHKTLAYEWHEGGRIYNAWHHPEEFQHIRPMGGD